MEETNRTEYIKEAMDNIKNIQQNKTHQEAKQNRTEQNNTTKHSIAQTRQTHEIDNAGDEPRRTAHRHI